MATTPDYSPRAELLQAVSALRDQLGVVELALTPTGNIGDAGRAFIQLGPRFDALGRKLVRWNAHLDAQNGR